MKKLILFSKIIAITVFCLCLILSLTTCGGGAGGMSIPASEYTTHNPTGWGGNGSNNTNGGSNNGVNTTGGTPIVVTNYVYNGNSYSKDQINDLIQVIRDNPSQPEGVFTLQFFVAGDTNPRYARVSKTSSGVDKFEHQYKATLTNSRDTTNFPVTISFYKDDGINLSAQTTSNMAGWRCAGNNQLYGSFITGMQGDVTLNAEFATFTATPTKTELTASTDITNVDTATLTITGGTGPFSIILNDSDVLQASLPALVTSNPPTYTSQITIKVDGSSFVWFNDDRVASITVRDDGSYNGSTYDEQIKTFTLKNKYKVNILNPNSTAAGVLSPNEFYAGSTLNMASLASVVSDPSPRQIVAYKDTSTGGNTYKTTDTVTLNSSNFTSRNITLQAKLNFTATISGGDTTISGQDGTYANPYHLKLGGTPTEQKMNIGITDKVGDIRIRAGTTGFVGVTGSGISFAAEISSGIDPNSVPATPILLKIIDIVPGTATTTAAENDSANQYATKEVYVQIDRPTLTVTFNANGGTNAPASVSVLYGNKISAPTTSPSKNGATFGGWYTSNDGGATLSATQFNFTSTSITSNLTLYAKWNDVTHSVTYNNSGCSQLNVNNISASYITFTEASGLTSLPTPSLPSGYTFDGWYSNSGLTGNRVTSIPANTTTNQTLYAKINVDVTVDVRGTTNTIPVQYGNGLAASDLTSYAPTNLKHWSSVSRTGTIAYSFNNSNITMPMTLYAVIANNIYYYYADNTDPVPTSKVGNNYREYIEGTGLTLPASVTWDVTTGATFDGWYTSTARTNATKVTSISDTQTGDVTLYAKFSVPIGKTLSLNKATLDALAYASSFVSIATGNDSSTPYVIIPTSNITNGDLDTLTQVLRDLNVWFTIGLGNSGITKLTSGSFNNCTKLLRVTLPATSGFRVSASAFTNCNSLTDLFNQASGTWSLDMSLSPTPDSAHTKSQLSVTDVNGLSSTINSAWEWVRD